MIVDVCICINDGRIFGDDNADRTCIGLLIFSREFRILVCFDSVVVFRSYSFIERLFVLDDVDNRVLKNGERGAIIGREGWDSLALKLRDLFHLIDEKFHTEDQWVS